MEGQQNLFEGSESLSNGTVPDVYRYQGALVFSAVGDALGWPTEFIKEHPRKPAPFKVPLHDFVRWKKFVSGRWWGYQDDIGAGEYSDDTQLTLAVSRSISTAGEFEPHTFAYEELPLWLHYERGGGRSIKAAARWLIRRKSHWLENFYKQGNLDYRQAGANGAAMRTLPIVLASFRNEKRLVRDSFLNAVITHGHPRAILGAILYGLAVRYALSHDQGTELLEYLHDGIESAGQLVADDGRIREWIATWERRGRSAPGTFKMLFAETRGEVHQSLLAIPEFKERPLDEYYRFVGALNPATKGSGVASVCAAIFLFMRLGDSPSEAIYAAVNLFGSDTDTIASFLGALLGARFGLEGVPGHLLNRLQDRDYLIKTANRLRSIAAGGLSEQADAGKQVGRSEAFLRLFAWEIGLHEMFWDAIDVGDGVVHPTLGRGVIVSKDVRRIAREGYSAKLIRIKFECGQTCVFHSRVEHNQRVTESLARDLEKALED